MRYGILGALELEDGAGAIRLNARKQRVLLICLLLRANEIVSTDELVEALWGSEPPRSASKLLQMYVSQLRRVLDDGALETRPPGYVLHVEPDELDASRFEHTLDDAREALAGGNAPLAASLFRRALALWRGRALHDVAYEAFASSEARRLEERRLVCLEGRLAAELELGMHDAALPELDALVREHPLREELRRLLMLALYRSGRQADALAEYREAARLLRDELGLEPGEELRALEAAILNQDPSLAEPPSAAASRASVPVPASSLVGREEELAQLAALVSRREVRVVTVNGAGGSGKTRVALELARRAGPTFANGVAFVELGPLADPSLVIPAIGQALGAAEAAGESRVVALCRSLRDQELLLVLDNFEHLVDAAADVATLVSMAPRLTVLVTSRRVLHISGEHVFPLQPLPEADAARLFVERSSARSAPPGAGDEEIVRAICRRLDGLPLAIELAAARASTLPPALLLDRLSSDISALGSGPRDAPARQKTLADTLWWSTDLLAEPERNALARLSVFRGGSSLEAAEVVAGATAGEIETLVDTSLLQRVVVSNAPRLTMLETVREHAGQLLDRTGERSSVEVAHGRYFVELVDQGHIRRPDEAQGTLIDDDLDNFRAAIENAAERGDSDAELRLVGGLWRYWWVRGRLEEGRTRTEAALARRGDVDGVFLARALVGGAGLCHAQGDQDRAHALATEALAVARAAGSPAQEVVALNTLGAAASRQRRYGAARRYLQESIAVAVAHGLADRLAAKLNLGDLELEAGRPEAAVPIFEELLLTYREPGIPNQGLGFAAINLAHALRRLDQPERAREYYAEALDAFRFVGFRVHIAHALQGLGVIEARVGDPAAAAALLGQAGALLQDVGARDDFEPGLLSSVESSLRAQLGDDAFSSAYEKGKAAATERTFPSDPAQ
jgi:predicted ATPase/DNA-binding SARP family transcriptional activator